MSSYFAIEKGTQIKGQTIAKKWWLKEKYSVNIRGKVWENEMNFNWIVFVHLGITFIISYCVWSNCFFTSAQS